MQIMDAINQMGGLQAVARELGVSESQAATGAAALLPAILGGFRKQAQSGASSQGDLGALLGGLGGGGLLDDVLGPQPTNVGRGNDVLGQIFGSKDVSRAVAQNAAARTGLDDGLLRKMLPMLAMLAAGYMAKQGAGGTAARSPAAGGGLGGALGGLLGADRAGPGAGGLGGLASLLDADGDGNPLDDILGMLGKKR